MRIRLMGSILALVAVLAFSSVIMAQTAEQSGATKVQITASTPDLTGVWNLRRPPGANFLGYAFTKEEPPMTPWAEEKFKATKPSFGPRGVEDSNDPVNPTTVNAVGCFPPGVPRIYLHPFPMEILQVPGRVIMIFEFNHFVRQIYTDGRQHPEDLAPTWMGDSIGKWEGDTLVVDTIGFNDKTWLDRAGHPHSDALHLTERIRRVDRNTLQNDFMIDDPKAYAKPWGAQLGFQLRPGWNLMELVCEDNINFNDFLKNEAKPSK